MENKLSLLASVAVIAVTAFAAYQLANVDRRGIATLNKTVKMLNDTLTTKEKLEEKPELSKQVLYSGIVILFLAALYIMFRGKK